MRLCKNRTKLILGNPLILEGMPTIITNTKQKYFGGMVPEHALQIYDIILSQMI